MPTTAPVIGATTTVDFAAPAPREIIGRTAQALRDRGFDVSVAVDREDARRLTLAAIPDGAEVHEASSRTIDELGISAEIHGSGRYQALKPRLWSMDRATQADQIRRLGAAPDVLVGSVHAITEAGEVVAASMTGSQLAGYAGGAGKVVWVVGSQKIVPDLASAFERIERHTFPLEDARAQAAYGVHSAINKLLIFRGEFAGRVSIIIVPEAIGF